MSTLKKSAKSKFISEDLSDFINESQFLNDSPKTKKQQKRQRNETAEKDNTNLSLHASVIKKKKINEGVEACGESRQKILNVMSQQLEARKQINENLLKSLSEVLTHFETDYNALKENEQKIEHLTGSFMKCIQQATAAHKQKLRAFKEIHSTFKKECEEMEAEQKAEVDKLGDELEEDINKLKQKLISETKRSGWETLRRSFLQAMQNDF
ncbi:uncharacterized protein LOC125065672 [Vanessa atalanta]|uniref:uncharacterized protein LOC125065672 n=1 Tax=Vanessa atalanta TaxID=42275 RepID=UPI001FCDF012|nr:uncharacterized protein LOC125065672 [Vanessa atalanta]